MKPAGSESSEVEPVVPNGLSGPAVSNQRVGDNALHLQRRGGRPFLAHYARQFGTFAGLIGLCIVLWILTPHFLTVSNLLNVAQQTSINAIIAVGLTFVIISGGIDLSVGSLVAFTGVVLASLLQRGLPYPVAILGGLATGEILFVPVPVIIMGVIYAIAHFVLRRTSFGRYVFAIGGNEEAALLSGVPVHFHKTMVYGASGLLTGAAAVVLTARLNSAQPIAGINYELDAIAATVIGGTSLLGGQGSVIGTLIGALIMGVLRNGLNLVGVSSFTQQLVIGAVIILAVLMDMAFKRPKR